MPNHTPQVSAELFVPAVDYEVGVGFDGFGYFCFVG
jgi:hypothetical protein